MQSRRSWNDACSVENESGPYLMLLDQYELDLGTDTALDPGAGPDLDSGDVVANFL